MGHHHTPLVLSLSQIQSGGGLLIVNPHNGGVEQLHAGHMNGLTPLPPPTSGAGDVNGHLLHSTGSTRSDTSSNSPLGGLASPVSSAVRSLTNLSDFSLDVSNGNYDNYGGITDSLLSAEASKTEVEIKHENGVPSQHHPPISHQRGGGPTHGQGGAATGGPLLDFKSAFSDLESKPSDLR
jgi:hypothetical protein